MNNRPDELEEDDIPETDVSGGVRGKYYERAVQGSNFVLLEPDVAKVFRDSTVASQALREYLSERGAPPIASKEGGPTSRGSDQVRLRVAGRACCCIASVMPLGMHE